MSYQTLPPQTHTPIRHRLVHLPQAMTTNTMMFWPLYNAKMPFWHKRYRPPRIPCLLTILHHSTPYRSKTTFRHPSIPTLLVA